MNSLKKVSLSFLLVVTLWFCGYAIFLASILLATQKNPDETTDAIVVLTGGHMRIETGLNLFAKGRAGHLFITGVHPKVSKREIKEKWSGDIPLPPCCITLGHKANTTVENAEETRDWLKDKDYTSIRLITADFHMNRARVEFRHSIPDDIEIIPHPIEQPNMTVSKLRFWKLSFIEYHKTIFRSIRVLFAHKGSGGAP